MADTKKPEIVIEMGPEDVEAVMREYEAENPGRTAQAMSSDEFANRFMKRMYANAQRVQ